MNKVRTPEIELAAKALYEQGIKVPIIVKQLGISKTVVYECLKSLNVPRTQNVNVVPEKLYSIIANMYQNKIGYASIANQLGYPRAKIREVIVNQGIKIQLPTKIRYNIDEYAFDIIDNELAAYWLGFIYADGCVHKNRLSIDLHAKDKSHLEKIKPFLKTKRPIYEYQRKSPKAIFQVTNNHLAKRLKELGILVDRPNINIPISRISLILMSHFIRGYFDGDGSARKKRITIRFCGQKDILEWLVIHFRTILTADCSRKIQTYKHTDKMFLLEFSPRDSLLIRDYLYQNATIWLERKRKIMDNWE